MSQTFDRNADPAIARLRRKLEILRLDFKGRGDPKHYDISECLSLLDIIERTKDRGEQTAQ